MAPPHPAADDHGPIMEDKYASTDEATAPFIGRVSWPGNSEAYLNCFLV